jgi:DNA-binding beta-propeller fold protein YncE
MPIKEGYLAMKTALAVVILAAAAGIGSVAAAAETLYIPLGSAGEALIIDTRSDEIVGRIQDIPDVHGLAATADGKLLIAASLSEQEGGAGSIPDKPEGVAEDEHAGHHGANPAMPESDTVSILSLINARTSQIMRRIEVPGAVHHVATTPDSRFAIATHPSSGQVSIVDLERYALVATLATGPAPNYAVVSPDGARIFVSNAGNDTISEIDPQRWIVRRNFVAGKSPEHMVLSQNGQRLYVANVDDGTVSEIDAAEGVVMRTFEVGGRLHGIDLSEDGRRLFVSARERNELVVMNLHTLEIFRATLGPAPYHVATAGGAGKLYVSSAEEPKIWVLDLQTLQRLAEIPIRGEGHQMAVTAR